MTDDEWQTHCRTRFSDYDERFEKMEARQDQHLAMLNAFREESRAGRAHVSECVETLSDRVHDLLDVVESLKRFVWVFSKIGGFFKAVVLPVAMIIGAIVSLVVYLKTGVWTGSGK